MVESGLFVERAGGTIRSPIIPWFDMSFAGQVEKIKRVSDSLERFCITDLLIIF
jgi:hypothetical protein